MRTSRKQSSLLLAVVFTTLLLAITPTLISTARQPGSLLPPAVAPEPYPNSQVYPAAVLLESQDDLQVLYRLEIDIGNLEPLDAESWNPGTPFVPSIATVYIDPAQSNALHLAGLELVPIPNQGYRSFLAYGPGSGAPEAWPTFGEYVARMQALETAYPNLVDLVQIGSSVNGRPLYCLQVTDNPGADEIEPEFKYSANHHGDETTGVELTMRLAELLASSYGTDPDLTDLVDKMEIWLCPIYNPDGYVAGRRYNAHNVDLNRDFPDRFTDPIDDPVGHEAETQAYMIFGYNHRFVMGANYHGGAQVLNYPWDAVAPPGYPIIPAFAPDDSLFYDFGYGYTSRNTDLWNGGWPDGMTRGWQWYQIWGGMQDWAYYYRGEHHVTLEISNIKSPPYTQMDLYWEHNRDAMLWWMQQALTGITGVVVDARNSTPLDASLSLVGREPPNTILTDPQAGDYHRVISAGTYTLNASAECYQAQTVPVSVVSGTATVQDFYLEPLIDLSPSMKTASSSSPKPGDSITYQIRVENNCLSTTATVTDTLPVEVTWTGYLTATQGTPIFASGQILWQDIVTESQPITITYGVTINPCLAAGIPIVNHVDLYDGYADTITRTVELDVANDAPSLPALPSPADGALNQPISTTLSWAPSSDLNCDALTYALAFGTSPTPTIIASGLIDTSYDPGPLQPGTTYYWYVVADDGLVLAQGPTWHFTTQSSTNRIFLPLTLR